MGRFFVHMDGGGKYVVFSDLPSEELNRRLEKQLNFLPFLALEELRAGGNQCVHEADAVFAGFAARHFNPAVGFL